MLKAQMKLGIENQKFKWNKLTFASVSYISMCFTDNMNDHHGVILNARGFMVYKLYNYKIVFCIMPNGAIIILFAHCKLYLNSFSLKI